MSQIHFFEKRVRIFSHSTCCLWNFDLWLSSHFVVIIIIIIIIIIKIEKTWLKLSKTEENRTPFCRRTIQIWPHQILKWLKQYIGSWNS